MPLWHSPAGELVDETDRQMSVEVHVSIFKISTHIPFLQHEKRRVSSLIADGLLTSTEKAIPCRDG